MQASVDAQLAQSDRGLLIAPAGCGKTETVARAVTASGGKQLVLTHTHAGVRALKSRLRALGVPQRLWRVETIDGFSLRYALYFPRLSGFSNRSPSGNAWNLLRQSILRGFRKEALRRLLQSSYDGVFIDEYQDCVLKQHLLILLLSELVPVRIVADPLQGVFGPLGADFDWHKHVAPEFERLPDLAVPWRWIDKNPALGEWLQYLRTVLVDGGTIDWRCGPLTWLSASHDNQRRACFRFSNRSSAETVIAIRKWRSECYEFAKTLRGTFTAMEEMDCEGLKSICGLIDSMRGLPRALAVLEIASSCLTGVTEFVRLARRIDGQELARIGTVYEDYPDLGRQIRAVAETESIQPVRALLSAIGNMPHTRKFRRELWDELRRTVDAYLGGGFESLNAAAWSVRQRN